jgi:hypothetical protein
MFKKPNSTIIIGLCTAVALIAFAFNQRYGIALRAPASAFYIAAAVICLLPVLYGLIRHKACQNKRSRA